MIDVKLKQLRRDYEQYFLGARPREPIDQRSEIQKTMIRLANGQIKNTGERFKFNTLNSRFLTHKRRWDDILRKIENGTYERHVFKANLRERDRAEAPAAAKATAKPGGGKDDIFDSYIEAARSCGQNVAGLTPEKLKGVIDKQTAAIKKQTGAHDVKFRVEVVDGKVKLKAKATKAA
jgi:hypothetical protein